jgi:hypothetical protein
MKEWHIMVEVKIKDKILTSKDIRKAKKKLPDDFISTDTNPAVIIGKKSATIVFNCIKIKPEDKAAIKILEKEKKKKNKIPQE